MSQGTGTNLQLNEAELKTRKLRIVAEQRPRQLPELTPDTLDRLLGRHHNSPEPHEMAYLVRLVQSEDLFQQFNMCCVQRTDQTGVKQMAVPENHLNAWINEMKLRWKQYVPPSASDEINGLDRHGSAEYGRRSKVRVQYIR